MVAGKWNVAIKSPMGELKGEFDFNVDGEVLTGTLTDANGANAITDGKVNGEEFTFKTKLKTPMGGISFTFSGTVDGDNVSGKAKMMMGSMEFKGTRA